MGGWHMDALSADLPLLDFASLSGKIKFLGSAKPTWEKCQIGYVIDLDALPIPQDEIPVKYKKERVIDPVKRVTIPALGEATYEVHFEFHLMDADGFDIVAIESPKHLVQSGKTSRIQSQSEPSVTIAEATRLGTVNVAVFVDKCVSATD
jgi:hypothetical protein